MSRWADVSLNKQGCLKYISGYILMGNNPHNPFENDALDESIFIYL